MDSLADLVTQRVGSALGADPLVRPSDHADFQANGALAEAKRRGVSPRDLAATWPRPIVDHRSRGRAPTWPGPGFINLTLAAPAIWRQVAGAAGRRRGSGSPTPLAGERIVIDYSAPEHRQGDARRAPALDGHRRRAGAARRVSAAPTVIRQNHVGDWGTQFGMLIAYLDEHPESSADARRRVRSGRGGRLTAALPGGPRRVRRRSGSSPTAPGAKVVALQSGDEAALAVWRDIVDESKRYFTEVYDLLGVLLTEADVVGESFYNDRLAGDRRDARRTRGRGGERRRAVRLLRWGTRTRRQPGAADRAEEPTADSGTRRPTSPCVAYRVDELGADRIWYVVDARQALHFRMVFDTATPGRLMPAGSVECRARRVRDRARPGRQAVQDPLRRHRPTDRAAQRRRSTTPREVVAEKNPDLPEADARRTREGGRHRCGQVRGSVGRAYPGLCLRS